jgi:hypothetical protein
MFTATNYLYYVVPLENLVCIIAKNIVHYDPLTSTDEYVNQSFILMKQPKSVSLQKCVSVSAKPHNRSAH